MKNIILLLTYCCSCFIFSQNLNMSKGVPTFYGFSSKKNEIQKAKSLKNKTQLFLSKNINSEFIKEILKPGDSINFSYKYIIGKSGYVIQNKTKVNTQYPFFNNKIISIINKLKKFNPAIGMGINVPVEYTVSDNPEFFVNNNYNLIPVFREKTKYNIDLKTNNKRIGEIYDSIKQFNLNDVFLAQKKVKIQAYFSTSKDKKITKLKILSEFPLLNKKLKIKVKKIILKKLNLYKSLKINTNYNIKINIIYCDTQFDLDNYIEPDSPPSFPGCENKKNILDCNDRKLFKFYSKNFNKELEKKIKKRKLKKHGKLILSYIINEKGSLNNIKVISEFPELSNEIKKILRLLPKFTPASNNNIPCKWFFYEEIPY